MAFPYNADEWGTELHRAQLEHASIVRTIATEGDEHVRLLVVDDSTRDLATSLLGKTPNVDFIQAKYGDCWTRDTAPTFMWEENSKLYVHRFKFNGWGHKYEMPW